MASTMEPSEKTKQSLLSRGVNKRNAILCLAFALCIRAIWTELSVIATNISAITASTKQELVSIILSEDTATMVSPKEADSHTKDFPTSGPTHQWTHPPVDHPPVDHPPVDPPTSGPPTSLPSENNKFPSYCESMETNLKQLRSRLHSDPQSSALRNVVVQDSTGNNHSIPGLTPELIEQVFVGHRIVLMGDSTLYYPTKWLYRLLEYHFSHGGDASLSNQTLDEGNRRINPDMDQHLHLRGNPTYVHSSTHTNIRWMGFAGSPPPRESSRLDSCDFSKDWQEIIQQHQPTVMVVNMGLHWLHFSGIAREVRPCVVDRWIHYEDFLQEALEVAAASNTTRLVLFKTTNSICSSKYTGLYAKADQSFSSDNNTNALDKCQQAMANVASNDKTTVVAEGDIQTFCRHGTFNEAGSHYLNQRLRQFVQQQQQKPNSKVSMSIFNDHDVESCPYTGRSDGRHYHPLNLLRIRMLANTLACYDLKLR